MIIKSSDWLHAVVFRIRGQVTVKTAVRKRTSDLDIPFEQGSGVHPFSSLTTIPHLCFPFPPLFLQVLEIERLGYAPLLRPRHSPKRIAHSGVSYATKLKPKHKCKHRSKRIRKRKIQHITARNF